MKYEYIMTKEMAKAYLDARKESDKKLDVQKYLCACINADGRNKGTCVKVVTW